MDTPTESMAKDIAYIASVFRKLEELVESIGPDQIEQAAKVFDSPMGKMMRKLIG